MNGSRFFSTFHVELRRYSDKLGLKSYLSSACPPVRPAGRDGFPVCLFILANGLVAALSVTFTTSLPPSTHPPSLQVVCPWVLLSLSSLFPAFHSHCYTFVQAHIPSGPTLISCIVLSSFPHHYLIPQFSLSITRMLKDTFGHAIYWFIVLVLSIDSLLFSWG